MSAGLYPDAPPTAPGGMSRKALIKELVDDHDYEDGPEWNEVGWPDLINLVAKERQDREAERPEAETVEDMDDPVADMFPDEVEDMDEPDELDEFFGGFEPVDFNGDDIALALKIDAMFGEALARPLDAEVLAPSTEMGVDVETGEILPVAPDDACKCGTPESEHYSVDPELHVHDRFPGTVVLDEEPDSVLDPETMFAEMFTARTEAEKSQPAPLFLGIPGVRDYVFDGHAGAGPSGAERWMNCTMSLSLSREFLETLTPNQQHEYASGSQAARQGTTAHAAGEAKALMMLGRIDEDELDHVLLDLSVSPDEGEQFDNEMDEYTDEYVDLIRTYAEERGNESILIERRVEAAIPLTGVHEGEVYIIRGSLDFGALPVVGVPSLSSLVVGDLKYGEGKDVDVDENPQIRIYGLGLLEELVDEDGNLPASLKTIDYYINQPRLGGIKKWSESIDDLLEWRDEVLAPALTAALYGRDAGGATFAPSDLACQWCPARGMCPALAEHVMTKGEELFDAIQDAEFTDGPGALPDPVRLDNDALGSLLLQIRDLDKLQKSLREEAQRRLHRGEEVKNFHLVNHTPKRTWKSDAIHRLDPSLTAEEGRIDVPDEVLNRLWTEPVLVSPTAAEKILGDGYEAIKDVVNKPDKIPLISTGPKDRRKAWEGRAPEDMFADDVPEND